MLKICFVLMFTLISSSPASAKEKAMKYMCGSNHNPRFIYVKHPLRGAASVQIGGADTVYSSAAKSKEKTGEKRDRWRFDFNDNNDSIIITVGGRDIRQLKKDNNQYMYWATYYDFSEVEEGETIDGISYLCFGTS